MTLLQFMKAAIPFAPWLGLRGGGHIIAVYGDPSDLITELMGSTNTSVPLYTAGISSVQLLRDQGTTLMGAHLV
jgi:hypothetical protein